MKQRIEKAIDIIMCSIMTAFIFIIASPYVIVEFIGDCLFNRDKH